MSGEVSGNYPRRVVKAVHEMTEHWQGIAGRLEHERDTALAQRDAARATAVALEGELARVRAAIAAQRIDEPSRWMSDGDWGYQNGIDRALAIIDNPPLGDGSGAHE